MTGVVRSDPCWCCKVLAGCVAGFGLAVAVAGIFVWAMPAGNSKFQLAMWLVAPVWLGVLSAVFLFRDGLRAWMWLGGANAVAYAALFLLRYTAR